MNIELRVSKLQKTKKNIVKEDFLIISDEDLNDLNDLLNNKTSKKTKIGLKE